MIWCEWCCRQAQEKARQKQAGSAWLSAQSLALHSRPGAAAHPGAQDDATLPTEAAAALHGRSGARRAAAERISDAVPASRQLQQTQRVAAGSASLASSKATTRQHASLPSLGLVAQRGQHQRSQEGGVESPSESAGQKRGHQEGQKAADKRPQPTARKSRTLSKQEGVEKQPQAKTRQSGTMAKQPSKQLAEDGAVQCPQQEPKRKPPQEWALAKKASTCAQPKQKPSQGATAKKTSAIPKKASAITKKSSVSAKKASPTAKKPSAAANTASISDQSPVSQTKASSRAAAPKPAKQTPALQAPAQQRQAATSGLRNSDSGSLLDEVGRSKGKAGRPPAGSDAARGEFDAAAWEAENAALFAAADAAMESD